MKNTIRTALLAILLQTGSVHAADMTDRLIVKFKPAQSGNTQVSQTRRIQSVRAASGAAVVPLRELANGAQLFQLPSAVDLATAQSLAAQIAGDAEVLYAEPDRIRKRALTPNDTFFSNQWQLYDTYGARLTSAWDVTTGSSAIVIAIVDTGYLPHADLAGRFLAGYDFISDPFIANDGDGRDADARDPGDWVTQADVNARPTLCSPSDISISSWHGLLVSGIVAANTNNGAGIAGANWGARILPVRTLGKCGGFTSDIADGMRWAAGLTVPGVPANPTPAHVINVSLGSSDPCSNTEQQAIDAIIAAGKVVVTAAGNEASDVSTHAPSNCANVIAVAATTRAGGRASYSNFGAGVTVSAPVGESNNDGAYLTWNTGTTSPGSDTYGVGVGTSFATAYVSGIVGLMLSVNPSLTPAQVKSIIQSTAQPFPSGSTCTTQICGAGIIDANAAVRTAAGSSASSAPPASGGGGSGGGGGGGGCSIAPNAQFDPALLVLLAGALIALGRRRTSARA